MSQMQLFRQSLAESVFWCNSMYVNTSFSHQHRSPALRPNIKFEGNTDCLPLIRDAVGDVVAKRHALIGSKLSAAGSLCSKQHRLIAFFPRLTIFDGFASLESNGFFDKSNAPPWDTWVCLVDEFIISFVPDSRLLDVNCGIATNVEKSITWLDEVNHPFVSELRLENEDEKGVGLAYFPSRIDESDRTVSK